MNDKWVWVRVKLGWLWNAVSALKIISTAQHADARKQRDKAKAAELRAMADSTDADAEAIREAMHNGREEK